MSSPSLAVTLLTMGTTYEKAVAIEGDLLEEARTYGRGWYMRQVFATSWALVRQSTVNDTLRVVLLAFATYELALKLNWWVIGPARRYLKSELALSKSGLMLASSLMLLALAWAIGDLLTRLLPQTGIKVAALAATLVLARVLVLKGNMPLVQLLCFGVLPMAIACWHVHRRNILLQTSGSQGYANYE